MEYFLNNLDHASFLFNVYNIHTLRIQAMGHNVFNAEDDGYLSGNFHLLEKTGDFGTIEEKVQ